jgi:hypothetical protein
MTRNVITGFLSHIAYQAIQLVSAEVFHQSAILADEDVVVPGIRSDKTLTTGWLVDPLDQANLFELFDGSIDGYQANFGVFLADKIEYLNRVEQAWTGCDNLNYHLEGRRPAITMRQ